MPADRHERSVTAPSTPYKSIAPTVKREESQGSAEMEELRPKIRDLDRKLNSHGDPDFTNGDVTIFCQRKHFTVSSVVLAASSAKFSKLLQTPQPEHLVLEENAEDIANLLRLMFGKSSALSLNFAQARSLWSLMSRFAVSDAVKHIFRSHLDKRAAKMLVDVPVSPTRDEVLDLLDASLLLHQPFALTPAEKAKFPKIIKCLITLAQVKAAGGASNLKICFNSSGGYVSNRDTFDKVHFGID